MRCNRDDDIVQRNVGILKKAEPLCSCFLGPTHTLQVNLSVSQYLTALVRNPETRSGSVVLLTPSPSHRQHKQGLVSMSTDVAM